METPLDLAHHLNMVRMNQTNGEVRRIPDVGYNMYKKNFEDPKLSEGFAEIKKLKFSPKFDSKRDENLFKQWTNWICERWIVHQKPQIMWGWAFAEIPFLSGSLTVLFVCWRYDIPVEFYSI